MRETCCRTNTYTFPDAMRIAPAVYHAAPDFLTHLATVQKDAELWHAVYRTARVPEGYVERARAIPGRWSFLALSEDWCGDSVNTLPLLARLVEQVPGWELRVLGRDANPELMDSHLTGTSRSIPVVMVLDEELEEIGWWGPRPGALQEWYLAHGKGMDKAERYKHVRTWYARDRGRTFLDELLRIAEGATAEPGVA